MPKWHCTHPARTADAEDVGVGRRQVEMGRGAVERAVRVWVREQLREKDLKDVEQLVQRGPRLVDDVEAHRARGLVHVGVEDPIPESGQKFDLTTGQIEDESCLRG